MGHQHHRQVGNAGRHHENACPPVLGSGLSPGRTASRRSGWSRKPTRSRSDRPPQTPYRSPYPIAWAAHWRITGQPAQIAFARASRAARLGPRSPSGEKKTALSTSRQAARNRHDHNPDQPTSSKGSCRAFIWVPRNADHTGPSAAQAKAPTSQVMRQQIAPWAGSILSRPGEVWVPGTSIPGEAGSQPGPLLVNLCGRPETAGFSHPHRWTSDGCQPALLPRDTTTLYRDDRRELAATADRRATCGTPPRAVYTAKEAKRLRLGLRDHRRLVQAATWVPARAPGRR